MKAFAKLILLLLIPLALILAYSLYPGSIGQGDLSLEKADLSAIDSLLPRTAALPQKDSVQAEASQVVVSDTMRHDAPAASVAADAAATDSAVPSSAASGGGSASVGSSTTKVETSKPLTVAASDSTKLRILFFGDSMLEGLAKRLCDYTMENGYDLTSVIWYSSSTKLWAETDTLQYFFDKVKPDFVMLCLGSNELFVRDLEKRDRYIGRLVDKLAGLPFIWISPPNWKDDSGINQLIIDHIGMDRYFDSRHLTLERSSDHAHPTHEAAALWMDTVAVWMSSSASRHPLRLDKPTEKRPRKFRQYLLKPVK